MIPDDTPAGTPVILIADSGHFGAGQKGTLGKPIDPNNREMGLISGRERVWVYFPSWGQAKVYLECVELDPNP